ncbi:MAG: MlaD family protein [Sulfitobacter sp.]
MSDPSGDVTIVPVTKSWLERASIVWVIPFLALVIALGVAWQSYANRGPLIAIEFENGAGIAANATELRYRDITVGVVEDLEFSDGLQTVVAYVRLDKSVAPYVDLGSTFWVVRPELTARGVTGLDTVLTGVFIEGSWDSEIGAAQQRFKGQSDAPLFRPGREGLQIAFRTSATGQLTDNSPILFRGIEVGRLGSAKISPQGNFAIVEAIIYEPHGRLITPSTRFWDTSGFSVSIGPTGAEIDFSSVASLLGGGITFDTFVSGGTRVPDGTVFEVFVDEASARNSVFNASEVETLKLSVVFDDNISGLSVGAPVELSGLKIGVVEAVTGIVDEETFGDARVRLNAVLAIQPAGLGLQDEVTPDAALAFLSSRVTDGMRARLASASLLVGGLKVQFVMLDDTPGGSIRITDDGVPVMPATKSEVSDAAATVEGVFTRLNNLPIEELLGSAIGFLNSAQALLTDEDLRETPGEVRGLLGDVRGIVASDDMKNIPVALNATLLRIEALVAQLETEKVVSRVSSVLDAAAKAAADVGTSVDGVPALIEQLNAVAAKADSLPLKDLTTELTALVSSAQQVIGTDAARQLPAALNSALDELNATLSELRAGGAVQNINATLSSARDAADAVAVSTKDLPALVDKITRVFEQASATIAGYNKGDVISRDAQAALRDIQKAADAVTSLARMLERNPSALIRGR